MASNDDKVKVRYVRSASGARQQDNSTDTAAAAARQSSFSCVDVDDFIIVSDDAELMDATKNGTERFTDVEVMPMDVDRDDDIWVCCRCTLQNVAENTRCHLCEAPRHSISFHNHVLDSDIKQRQQTTGADSEVNMHRTGNNKKLTVGLDDAVDESDSAAAECDDNTQNTDWAVWTCSSCTYNNNPMWANICDVCETEKPVSSTPSALQKLAGIWKAARDMIVGENKKKDASGWLCMKCSTTNTDSVLDCACCGAVRMADSERIKMTWTCSKCTLQNYNVAHVCAACLSKRDIVMPQIDASDTKWVCPVCTCMNQHDQQVCQACRRNRLASRSCITNQQVPDSSQSNSMQQRSVFVKDQKAKEEMAARDQWIQIVNFCKIVSYFAA